MALKRICFIFAFSIFTLTVFSGSDNADLNERLQSQTENIINLNSDITNNLHESQIGNTDNTQIQIAEENIEPESQNLENENKDTDEEFYSIQSSGVATCFGKLWMFEEFDNNCNIVSSVVYNADVPIETRKYTYKNGMQDTAEMYFKDKIIKVKFTPKGFESEKKVYNKNDDEPIETTINLYNEKNQIVETTVTTNEQTYLKKFVYNENGEKKEETTFLNGEKISFIEFKKDKQIIHLFQSGNEIKSWEEKN